MKPYRRSDRVKIEIQRILAEAFINDVRDPRLQYVNVVRVEVSPDLKNAKVYVSIRDRSRISEVIEILNKAKGYFRTLLSKRMEIRQVPELKFEEFKENEWFFEY